MKRTILLSFFFLFLSASTARAAIVTINESGEVVWNVLAANDGLNAPERQTLEVKNIANRDSNASSLVKLGKENGRIKLSVTTQDGERTSDVTDFDKEVIEIEEQQAPNRIKIAVNDSGFEIKQAGFIAHTTFPISINPQSKELSIETTTGNKFLAILPLEAFSSVAKANTLNEIGPNGSLEIVEGDHQDLQYKISGIRNITLFNFFTFEVPIAANVSATTGQVIFIDQPIWLAVLNPFLT